MKKTKGRRWARVGAPMGANGAEIKGNLRCGVLGETITCLLLCLMATSNDVFSPEEYKQVSESDCDCNFALS